MGRCIEAKSLYIVTLTALKFTVSWSAIIEFFGFFPQYSVAATLGNFQCKTQKELQRSAKKIEKIEPKKTEKLNYRRPPMALPDIKNFNQIPQPKARLSTVNVGPLPSAGCRVV